MAFVIAFVFVFGWGWIAIPWLASTPLLATFPHLLTQIPTISMDPRSHH